MSFDIVFAHLRNDFSGSPKILKETIAAVSTRKERAKLYLGSSGNGFLSVCNISISRYWYHRASFRFLTLFTYFFSQIVLFCKLLFDRSIDEDAVIYVNTLLPVGAALYGKLTGRKVIYHVHEISVTPGVLKSMLISISRMSSSLNIYVSNAHMLALPISGVPARHIHNALDANLLRQAASTMYSHRHIGFFNVLMIASLRDYKGIPELMNLAAKTLSHDDIRFHLVVNDDGGAIKRYFAAKTIPENLCVYPRTIDTAKFYRQASLVLNLSRVDQWVETFGLTILEAMAFGIPVIVPPVGGPAELVEDAVQGFLVDSYDLETLHEKLLLLFHDEKLCLRMSAACRERATQFSLDVFSEKICESISSVRGEVK